VTGVDGGLCRQGKDFFANPGKKQLPVASGKIPPTDAIGKQDISAKESAGIGKVQAEAAGAVPGHKEELGVPPGRRNGTGFLQQLRRGDGAKTLGKAESEHGIGLEAEKRGVGMVVHGATGPVGQVGRVPDVIPVAVSDEEGVWFGFFLFQKIEETLRGIDGKPMAAKIHKVGVGGGEAAAIDQGFGHRGPFLKRFVDIDDYV